MYDIFINYRTGDTEQTASAFNADFSHRFGTDRVFFAGESIGAARPFDSEILAAVRSTRVLIALIGPAWLAPDAQGRVRLLDDKDDWVHREICEALQHGAHVLPVLVGRHTEQIRGHQLPKDINRLADLQAKRYDHRDSAGCLAHIAKVVTNLIPGLVDRTAAASAGPGADRTGQQGQGSNTVSGQAAIHGSAFQVGTGDVRYRTTENSHNRTQHTTNNGPVSGIGSIGGDFSGTFISDHHGPLNTGSGTQNNHPAQEPGQA